MYLAKDSDFNVRARRLAAGAAGELAPGGAGLARQGASRYGVPMAAYDRWYVYLARCGDGSLYTGIARNVERRLAEHASGKGARYTRGRGPISLFASRACNSRSTALRLELLVKSLPRPSKEILAQKGEFSRVARRLRRT